ncbi:MAG: protein adenylyltransferase SelO family protein, partial [Pseudomonadota bacterium]
FFNPFFSRIQSCALEKGEDKVRTLEDEAAEKANAVLKNYPEHFRDQWLMRMRAKLGLMDKASEDPALIQNLLDILHAESADFTGAFRALSHAVGDEVKLDELPFVLQLSDHGRFRTWLQDWQQRLQSEADPAASVQQGMLNTNPACIPRNHQIQRAIVAAEQKQDLSVFEQLLQVFSGPFEERPEFEEFQRPPKPEQRVLETFCGT